MSAKLRLTSLSRGECVRLGRDISGYCRGTIGVVAEVSEPYSASCTVAVDWPTPAERFGAVAKPTRDWFTQDEQDRFGFLERAE